MKANKEIAAYTLDALKKAGADHAQCIVSSGKVDEFNVDGGEFSLLRTLFNSSITMKALKDGKKGVISANKLDKESIDNAVKQCISAAESSVSDEAESIAPKIKNDNFVSGALSPDRDKFFDRLQEYVADVKNDYPKIILEQLVSKYVHSEIIFMNTNRAEFTYTYGNYDLSSMFSAHEGEKSSSFNGYYAKFDSLDKKLIDIGMQRTLFAESEQQIDTKPCAGKFVGKVIITPACLADILLISFGNFISDSTIIDGTSPWKSMLGKQVASDKLSVYTKPLDEQVVCGERFTGEGFMSENMEIIKDGVLKSFMLSNYGSRKTGFPRALNSSRNLFVQPGDTSLNDLVKSVDRGILLNRFSGGHPSTNGDFSGVAKNSFFIENGQITNALSETMISGNLVDMFKNITGISCETISDGVTVLPYILVDGITISGR
ncbi:MAG: TldD/PmbA family protein [Clostridiaceae bacterium]|nr:TldD/PmbA family protein [Clostridiaceae bacterium]